MVSDSCDLGFLVIASLKTVVEALGPAEVWVVPARFGSGEEVVREERWTSSASVEHQLGLQFWHPNPLHDGALLIFDGYDHYYLLVLLFFPEFHFFWLEYDGHWVLTLRDQEFLMA